jgi:hypothetical protein
VADLEGGGMIEEDLMCCGNCDNSRLDDDRYQICRISGCGILSAWYCDKWEFDNIEHKSRDMSKYMVVKP